MSPLSEMLVNSVRLVYIHSYYDYGKSAIRKILMYLLDTNICIYAIKGKYPVIAEKLLSIHPSDIKISAVTVMELEYGAAKSNWSDRSREAIKTFLASFEMLNATATKPTEPKPELPTPTPQPTPTESKAPEKKEDPWKAIRGMGRADEIIADLESGGVMSFSELSGFFFNTPHDDDHTTELTDLRKKFTAID
ncbi:MAG: type II toxin-antitoxin system VapC family toxin, partial [Oribacterium sp.]|nr:type II toxin-antitoxin system VapC family toxin [Oribacterium sp.]